MSLTAAEGAFIQRPLPAGAVTATALLTTTIVPEKVRLRFGATCGAAFTTADVEAARPPATRPPRPHPLRDALPALRLAERAGRCAAPSTAPPAPIT